MIPEDDRFHGFSFFLPHDHPDFRSDYPGANVHDWFDGSQYLPDGDFISSLNAGFASRKLAWHWLVQSYLGPDTAGVGVSIDGEEPVK